jgi:hypothetical protein
VSDWALRRASTDALVALFGIALVAAPVARAAEAGAGTAAAAPATLDSTASLEGLPIARVDLEVHDIFVCQNGDPFVSFYRLANALHIRTRDRTVRQQLLFAPGARWSEERGAETARTLRSLDYLEPQRMEARRENDSVVVEVETRDAWTTSPVLNLERGGGVQYGTVGLSERNLLGLGKALSFQYHEDATGIARSLTYRDPAVLGSRFQFSYGASSGTAGSSDILIAGQPFYAHDTPAASQLAWRRARYVASLFQSGGEIAELDVRNHESELWVGIGRERANGTILRVVGSVFMLDRHLGPTRLEPGAPPDFAGGDEDLRLRRIAAEVRIWHPDFIVREDIERIGRKEDFDVGSGAALKLGFAPELLGSTANEGYARADADAGARYGRDFGSAHASLSMRLRRGPLEVIRRLDARWNHKWRPGHVLVLSAFGMGGTDVQRDFQVIAGGLNGLRAYPVQALAGTELVRLNAEQRWVLTRNRWDLVSLGMAAFYDAARAWGPGAVGTSWFNAAGLGVRFATPHSALGPVFRVDVAWPISPTRDGSREGVITFGSSQAF